MELKLRIALDNDAFQDDDEQIDRGALVETLAALLLDIDEPALTQGLVRDINGNTVGEWSIR
jgi:hypothetical protein